MRSTTRSVRLRRPTRLASLAFAVALVVASCGSDDPASSAEGSTADTTTPADGTGAEPIIDDGYGGVVAPTETVSDSAAPADDASGGSVALADTDLGTILVDAAGLTLYLFTPDEGGTPTCTGSCATTWPPALVDGEVAGTDGIDAPLTTVEHPDGGTQLVIGGWPLYTFAADSAPGDVNGQGSGGNWFVVGPDGEPVE